MNEETIIQGRTMANEAENTQQVEKQGSAWKQVTLGGASGILMGAGAMYAAEAYAANKGETPAEDTPAEGEQHEAVRVAEVSDNMSFADAFAAARDQVGAGGVFRWHGGIYNTYTAEEWNGMSDEQKNDFAELVKPEVSAAQIDTAHITESTPDIHVHVHVHEAAQTAATGGDAHVAEALPTPGTDDSDDVHIVGYGEVDGHVAVALDVTGDGQADVAVIDVDDSGNLSSPDVVVDTEGNMATVGELASMAEDSPTDPYMQTASIENPDVAPDMPDYMNDADLSMMA